MKKTVPVLCLLASCCWIFTPPSTASAANSAKVSIGVGLIAGGIALGVHGADNAICFGGGCDNGGAVAEFFVGVGMIGVGTFFLIKGLRDPGNTASERQKRIDALNRRITFGVGPIKKGWAGAVRIRW